MLSKSELLSKYSKCDVSLKEVLEGLGITESHFYRNDEYRWAIESHKKLSKHTKENQAKSTVEIQEESINNEPAKVEEYQSSLKQLEASLSLITDCMSEVADFQELKALESKINSIQKSFRIYYLDSDLKSKESLQNLNSEIVTLDSDILFVLQKLKYLYRNKLRELELSLRYYIEKLESDLSK